MGDVVLVRSESPVAALPDRLGLEGALASLDRRARRAVAPGLAVRRALTWDAADRRDPAWMPQGVAASGSVLLVSWYAKAGGARISILDLATRRYRHALLVSSSLEPVHVHAGGLAWAGPWLYVAATRRGLLAFHLSDLALDPALGLVLPVRATYRGDGDFRFSYCSSTGSSLLAGEYGNSSQSRRLARFPLDPSGVLGTAGTLVDGGAVLRAQGAVDAGSSLFLSRSHGPWVPGSLYTGPPGALRRHRWALPMGPEDLTLSPAGDLLWSVTEHPRRRWIVGVPRRLLS